jgi:chemotaxis family two-component system sensor kinase Cph1
MICTEQHGSVILSVQDNETGMEPRHHETTFSMFKRLHQHEEFGGGTGAGLAIVRRIVKRHGGRVWVKSSRHGGATFCFTRTPGV